MREQEFRRGFRAIASGFALAMVAGVPGALAAPVGFVTSVAGRAEIQADSQASWQAAALDGAVSVGDSIRTGTNAGVEVLLVDDTVLSIGARASPGETSPLPHRITATLRLGPTP